MPKILTICLAGILAFAWRALSAEDDARAIVKAALDYWRDESSYSLNRMIIHRPDWERSMTLAVWTRGEQDALVRVTEPAKDAGNATLLKDREMWSFSPKTSRVIKIPSSMMGQSWMGSDFSNNDISRADKIVEDYRHRILARDNRDGHAITVIEAVPLEDAPVVWGREVISIRDDYLVLEHAFYDQDDVLIKRMFTLKIEEMGGKPVASVQRMENLEEPGQWTEIQIIEARFKLEMPDSLFTLSSLRNPR